MSILSGQTATLADGDSIVPLLDTALTYSNILNDCTEAKVHNKALKQLVTSICKTQLRSDDPDIFGSKDWYSGYGNTKLCYVRTTKPILLYTPPCGSRNAQINIINTINDVDNLQIEAPGFCSKLSKHFVVVRDNTVVFDITDKVEVFKILYDNLRII